ncbi:hypothetical protein DL764_003425 [Monosporascus ibericus]|uniref:Uncharacterized protein n=1 Tax=Monosporascus ibericus TaxID=155417 RepID=A0A4Q4THB1_9PEZI|nr:hypothetical protein DL764_003425 [Monosporascus ibericus]
MRLSLIPSAAALLLWATGRSSDTTHGSLDHPHHLLAPAEIRCTGATLNATEVEIAKAKAIKWGMENWIRRRTVEIWTYGNAAWWICNCKWIKKDPVVEEELVDFQARLAEECGPNQSGWLAPPAQHRATFLKTATSTN